MEENKKTTKKMFKKIIAGSISASIAEFWTLPFDTAKVNLQISNKSITQNRYRGFVDFFVKSTRINGLKSLWKGLGPGIYRQILYSGIRLGTYDRMNDILSIKSDKETKKEYKILNKIVSAFVTGTIAIMVAQPADLIKVRTQGELINNGFSTYQKGFFNSLKVIYRNEGVLAFWNGLIPNIARNSTINVAELVTYDIFKTFFIKNKLLKDNIFCYIASALSAGFVGTVVGSPLDVIKTRMLNSTKNNKMSYHLFNIVKKEGLGTFYNGFTSNYIRIGSWNVIMFLCFEELKKVFDKDGYKNKF